ncbi:hypothetical protein JVU11DRAFT_4562 [Chiua virens]|nr:hypothetical protein JVU11DRAFT_4562 [Chiua virens]
MILRVWAMYNRSRVILGLLLTMLLLEIIALVASSAFYSNPKNNSWFAIQVLEYSFCTEQFVQPIWSLVTDISQISLAVVLCMAAVVRFGTRSLRMYRATKQWRLDRYINLLVNQGILYFLGIILLNLFTLLSYTTSIATNDWQFILTIIVQLVPVYTLTPRFIISIRELYAHDVQGERVGGIDSGFGLSTLNSRGGVGGPMVFAAGVQSLSEVAENVEADDGGNEWMGDIELVPREVGSAQQV